MVPRHFQKFGHLLGTSFADLNLANLVPRLIVVMLLLYTFLFSEKEMVVCTIRDGSKIRVNVVQQNKTSFKIVSQSRVTGRTGVRQGGGGGKIQVCGQGFKIHLKTFENRRGTFWYVEL